MTSRGIRGLIFVLSACFAAVCYLCLSVGYFLSGLGFSFRRMGERLIKGAAVSTFFAVLVVLEVKLV